MAKLSSVEKNNYRRSLSERKKQKRTSLKAVIMNKDLAFEERFAAQVKLSEMPRNSSRVRVRNRCELSGRPRGFYRKFKLSRIGLRDLGSNGQIPGVIKSSW